MNSIYLKKFLNIFNYIFLNILLCFAKRGKNEIKSKTLLLIRLDSIGDYVLFRNFLEIIKEDDKYGSYKITLCGNIIWQNLAQTLDKEYVDNFIWINRKKFYSDLGYKFRILREVYKAGYETVIDTTYSREILYSDALVRASNSKRKIGSSGSQDKHVTWKRKLLTDKFYTKLVPASSDTLFEFSRNREFFELVLDNKVEISCPVINPLKLPKFEGLSGKFCVVFPGSNDVKRRWHAFNYAEICKHLIDKFGLQVVIPAGGGEKYIADEIKKNVKSKKLIDLSGKCSLTELAAIISNSEFLISNDTAAVHIAAAVGKRFLCISNGSYLGRFLPYPKNIFSEANYIFPDEVIKELESSESTISKWQLNSPFDINSITVDKVKKKIEDILGDK
jgi:ADP-heptose:LPS heptosyltransferase